MNVGNKKLIYLDTIIKLFEKLMNKKIFYKKRFYKIGNYNYTLADNKKLIKKINYNFKFDLKEIIKSCIKKKII